MNNQPVNKEHSLVCFGEILWDLLPQGALPGGAPMNVAYHLHALGLQPQLITRLGEDKRGHDLLRILNEKNIDTSHVQVDASVPTGIVNATQDARGDMSYDIVAPAAWDNIEQQRGLSTLVSDAGYFIFGSLAARSAVSRATLFALLDHAAIKVLDINLRAPHYNQPLLEQLMHRADILKLNNDELAMISSWYGSSTDMREQITSLCVRFGLDSMLVTRGAHGAIAFFNGQWAEHPGFRVTVADTVGSGDSFLAAFLGGIIRKRPLQDVLQFACALGSFVATRHGAWPVYKPEDVLTFISPDTTNR